MVVLAVSLGAIWGLRQGDSLSPLSPMLFGIVMEAFSRILDAAVRDGLILGFSIGTAANTSMMVSHLLFADDTLIFCDANLSQLVKLRGILSMFEAVSGLKINLGKSELVLVGDVNNMGGLVALPGCRQALLPMKCLGLAFGAKFKERTIWNPILEKLE